MHETKPVAGAGTGFRPIKRPRILLRSKRYLAMALCLMCMLLVLSGPAAAEGESPVSPNPASLTSTETPPGTLQQAQATDGEIPKIRPAGWLLVGSIIALLLFSLYIVRRRRIGANLKQARFGWVIRVPIYLFISYVGLMLAGVGLDALISSSWFSRMMVNEHLGYENSLEQWENVNNRSPGDQDRIVIAARVHDLPMLQELLDDGVDVNARSIYGITPLMAGAASKEITQILVERGANASLEDDGGSSALDYAFKGRGDSGKTDALIYLIDKTDIGALSKSPFFSAISTRVNPAILKLLLDKGADVNTVNNRYSPLQWAAESGNTEAAGFLIDHGADVERDGALALQLAASERHVETFLMLSEHYRPGDKELSRMYYAVARVNDIDSLKRLVERFGVASPWGEEALKPMIGNGNLAGVRLLIESGMSADTVFYGERNPLLYALEVKQREIFGYLLAQGADVDLVMPRNGDATALVRAARALRPDMVRQLLAAGASQKIRDSFGDTPLISVLSKKWHTSEYDKMMRGGTLSEDEQRWATIASGAKTAITECVRALLEASPEINAQDVRGDTAVLIAIRNHHADMIPLLASHGADLTIPNEKRETVAHWAINMSKLELMEQLIGRKYLDINVTNLQGVTTLYKAISLGQTAHVHKLIGMGADVEVHPANAATPLGLAVMNQDQAAMNALLDAGAGANRADRNGAAPLMSAVSRNCISCINALLKYGADPYLKNTRGQSAFSLATHNPEIFRLLVSKGFEAPIDTPEILAYAIEQGDNRLLESLLKRGAKAHADEFEPSLLSRAILKGNDDAAILLLSHGAVVDYKYENYGQTDLNKALMHDASDALISLLIERTKELNSTTFYESTNSGDIYLSSLAIAEKRGRFAIAEKLHLAGAKSIVMEQGDL